MQCSVNSWGVSLIRFTFLSMIISKIGGTPTHWEDFLRIPAVSQAIEIERNQEIFSAGLKALKRLSEADYIPAEVQGLKSLIDKAEIVKERAQGKTVVVMTYLPNPDT